jgi:hypothetical protein
MACQQLKRLYSTAVHVPRAFASLVCLLTIFPQCGANMLGLEVLLEETLGIRARVRQATLSYQYRCDLSFEETLARRYMMSEPRFDCPAVW